LNTVNNHGHTVLCRLCGMYKCSQYCLSLSISFLLSLYVVMVSFLIRHMPILLLIIFVVPVHVNVWCAWLDLK
jgi:hypothetical protein